MAKKKKASSRKRPAATKKRAAPRKKSSSRAGASAAPPPDIQKTAYTLLPEEMEKSLITGEHQHRLETYFGEEQYRELVDLARQAGARNVRGGSRVLILPGIMGSKLGFERWLIWADSIWVDPVDIGLGKLMDLATTSPRSGDVKSLGVILYTYLRLKLKLKIAGFHADFHHFDWRLSIATLGRRLADRIIEETNGRTSHGRHVSIVAHSMGGLVARSALQYLQEVEEPDHPRVRRLIMQGTPNFGSFVPVQAIRAKYDLLRKVAALDQFHSHKFLAENLFATLPGLLEMLPSPERYRAVDLYQAENWPATGPAAPRQSRLNAVQPVQKLLHAGDKRCVLIAGIGQPTITNLRKKEEEFEYLESNAGDGTVPYELARLDNVPTLFVEETHGSLPNNSRVIQATLDLLKGGSTRVLPSTWDTRSRSAERVWKEPDDWGREPEKLPPEDVTPRYVRQMLFDVAAPMQPAAEIAPTLKNDEIAEELSEQPIVIGRRLQQRIDIILARGDVTQVNSRAVILGLFNDVDPAGAALAFDQQLDGAITEFTERRMFSGNAGEVFVMPAARHRVRAEFVVFIGLGSFDSFSTDVVNTVTENAARTLVRTGVNEFACVMLGGNSVAGLRESLEAMLKGFLSGIRDAAHNHRMRSVTICENDPKRYQLIQSELLRLATTPVLDEVEITVESQELPSAPEIASSVRSEQQPDPCYLFVREQSATFGLGPEENQRKLVLQSSVLTPAGKATVVTDSVTIAADELDKQLAEIATGQFDNAFLRGKEGFGNRLARTILPPSVRSVLETVTQHRLVVIHDAVASRIPWETIALSNGTHFPAQEAGLFRRYSAENLSVAKWLESRRQDRKLAMLLIVNPTLNLRGAKDEGDRINQLFEGESSFEITMIEGNDATWPRLQTELKSGRYDVLHYAGHAYFDRNDRARSGLICAGRRVLSGADLAGIGDLPALVFFNACEAARTRDGRHQSRANQRTDVREQVEKSVSLAEALLRGGIANYIGTYWPVGDAAAYGFADVFYRALLNQQSLGEAIQAARKKLSADLDSVDWADYVLYGSPKFRLKTGR